MEGTKVVGEKLEQRLPAVVWFYVYSLVTCVFCVGVYTHEAKCMWRGENVFGGVSSVLLPCGTQIVRLGEEYLYLPNRLMGPTLQRLCFVVGYKMRAYRHSLGLIVRFCI